MCTQVTYGEPAIYPDDQYPVTELTNTERRYRVREGSRDKVFDKFVFISIRNDFPEKVQRCSDFKIKPIDEFGMYLVTDNHMKTGDFIELVNNVEEKEICTCK